MLRSNIIKICLFATGLSGIVAEYLLATLAAYFINDTILQWTMIVSVMLFCMGLGSRISRSLYDNLLIKFILIESALSIIVSVSTMLAFLSTSYTIHSGFIIYAFCIMIGLMIGMEIPIAIRLNDKYESLRVNVSAILENDYYGSLVGGVFFAFVARQYIGLTYTPFILGFINFGVAFSLFLILKDEFSKKERQKVIIIFSTSLVILISSLLLAKPIEIHGEQKRYKDLVVFSEQSKYQHIVITKWHDDYWLYINGNQQLCTIDEIMYHEPLVHPAMALSKHAQNVLVLGGGDGCAVREILKHPSVEKIDLVDLDPVMTDLGKNNLVLKKINQNAMNHEKVNIYNNDGLMYIETTKNFYDVIIIDLPDPKTIDLGKLYSREFYSSCYRKLRPNGILITQAGSPYYATAAFICIEKTIKEANFATLPLHNQILTIGEWGWILGAKNKNINLKETLLKMSFDSLKTQWLNNEAMKLMTSFGKSIYVNAPDSAKIETNTFNNPVLQSYYRQGNWDLY